jgi:hypothetical protein
MTGRVFQSIRNTKQKMSDKVVFGISASGVCTIMATKYTKEFLTQQKT